MARKKVTIIGAGMTGGAMAERLIELDICDVVLQDDPQFAALFRLHLRRVEDLLHDALRAARDAGELTPHGSPRSHARMVLATLQGLAVTGRVMDSPSFSRGVIEATLAALRP